MRNAYDVSPDDGWKVTSLHARALDQKRIEQMHRHYPALFRVQDNVVWPKVWEASNRKEAKKQPMFDLAEKICFGLAGVIAALLGATVIASHLHQCLWGLVCQ